MDPDFSALSQVPVEALVYLLGSRKSCTQFSDFHVPSRLATGKLITFLYSIITIFYGAADFYRLII
jgi:hypothetical protein